MDADLLRIILVVFGLLVIAGVYWWERRGRTGDTEPDDEDPLLREDIEPEGKREPRLGPWEGNTEQGGGARGGDASQTSLSESVSDEALEPEREAVPEPPPGPMLVALYVASLGEPFGGAAIVHAAGRCGLEPGEMDIFHCSLGEGPRRQVLFSMANMVTPGTFPFGAMAEFQSPGLTLFAQLDGSPDDPGRMEELLGTGHALAEELDAELRDGQRQPLTREVEDELREQVMALVESRLAGDP